MGMFISPHLETMRERILYDGEMIPQESFVKTFELVREESDRQKEKHPSFFEFLFLMGMCYFKEKNRTISFWKPDLAAGWMQRTVLQSQSFV